MSRRAALFAAMFTLLLAFGSLGSVAAGGGCIPQAGTPTEGTGVAVSLKSCLFGPAILHAPVGVPVTWTNDDYVPHAVAGAGWSANADPFGMFAPGSSVTHTFDAPGIYAYMCHIHPGMAGLVIVGDVAFPPAPPAPLTPQTPALPGGPGASAATDTTTRQAAPAVGTAVAAVLVVLAAAGGYAFARWPRRWRPSAVGVRAALVDRRRVGVAQDRIVELPGD